MNMLHQQDISEAIKNRGTDYRNGKRTNKMGINRWIEIWLYKRPSVEELNLLTALCAIKVDSSVIRGLATHTGDPSSILGLCTSYANILRRTHGYWQDDMGSSWSMSQQPNTEKFTFHKKQTNA